MQTIKLTYTLEIEVPADALLLEGDTYAQQIRQMLQWNEPRGWKARLRRLVGVTKGRCLPTPLNSKTAITEGKTVTIGG